MITTGETGELQLGHASGEAERFYRQLMRCVAKSDVNIALLPTGCPRTISRSRLSE